LLEDKDTESMNDAEEEEECESFAAVQEDDTFAVVEDDT